MRVGLRLLSICASVAALVLGLAVTTGFERTPAPFVPAQELTLAVDEPPPAIAAVDTNSVRAAACRLLTRADSFAGFVPVAALLAVAFLARRKPDLRLALARVDRARRAPPRAPPARG